MGYTLQQLLDAAKVPPSKRSASQQAMVSRGSNIQAVRNADAEARRIEKNGG